MKKIIYGTVFSCCLNLFGMDDINQIKQDSRHCSKIFVGLENVDDYHSRAVYKLTIGNGDVLDEHYVDNGNLLEHQTKRIGYTNNDGDFVARIINETFVRVDGEDRRINTYKSDVHLLGYRTLKNCKECNVFWVTFLVQAYYEDRNLLPPSAMKVFQKINRSIHFCDKEPSLIQLEDDGHEVQVVKVLDGTWYIHLRRELNTLVNSEKEILEECLADSTINYIFK